LAVKVRRGRPENRLAGLDLLVLVWDAAPSPLNFQAFSVALWR